MDEPKTVEFRLNVDVNNFETLYSEVIQIEANPDRIILNFLQRLPGDAPEQPNAKIVSRIVLTWPHFGRLLPALQSIFDGNREQAKVQFLHNVCPGENN